MAPKFIDSHSAAELDGVTFAFACVDKGSARAGIIEHPMVKWRLDLLVRRDRGLYWLFLRGDAEATRRWDLRSLCIYNFIYIRKLSRRELRRDSLK